MSKLIWAAAWISTAIWSLLCWLAAFALDAAAGLAAGSGGVLSTLVPGIEPLVRSLAGLADQLGDAVLVTVWAVVSVAILAGAWLLAQVAAAFGRRDGGGNWFNTTAGQMPFAGPFMDAPHSDVGPVIDQPAAQPQRPQSVGANARAIARTAVRRLNPPR
ncbi:MAG: hypothetical protein SFV21_03405 [Rhodospirillaceae bacterium]|nr:hypothetical protein [Rhodospirillaceae bacterium]